MEQLRSRRRIVVALVTASLPLYGIPAAAWGLLSEPPCWRAVRQLNARARPGLAMARENRDSNVQPPPDYLGDAPQTKRVFVCSNKWCKEKGSGATLGSFIGLANADEVLVQGVNCLGRCNKGPNLRVQREDGSWLEFNRIDSVDRVYKILRDYLSVSVSRNAAECLKYNFLGNAHLDRNEVSEAIENYDRALATGWADQEGVLLVMRATAYLQRAYGHRRALTALLSRVAKDVPDVSTLKSIAQVQHPRMVIVMLDKLASYCAEKESLYQTTKFRYGLYEFALLRACDDALRATQLLPNYAKCWLRAGDALAELRKLEEAADFYRVALDLDPSLEYTLQPTIDRLRRSGSGAGGASEATDAMHMHD